MRWLPLLLAVFLTAPAHAASLRDIQLEDTLKKVAAESSEGTPRAMNEHITDMGFEAQGDELINRLSVSVAYAERMQEDPLLIRTQLQASVCTDLRFRRLLDMGATLTYHFSIKDSNQPVLTQSFIAEHCQTL